jgi:ribosomal protein S27E
MQNLQDPEKDWGSNGDLEQDRRLRGIEGEAFLLGNILFREWTEYAKKNEKGLNESKTKKRKNDKGEIVPEKCDKCGGEVVVQIHGEPVYICKECGKYFGTMPFKLNEAINIKQALKDLKKRRDPDNIENWDTLTEITDELVEPDDVDLSSFNIKKHLNPKFWDDGHLDTRIRLKLLDIADDFFDSLGVDWVEPEDVVITGSLANYNWNDKYSDIDLHILVDYEDVDERVDFVREYFMLKKNEWNEKHKGLRIFGFPVEVYVQDANEAHASSGVYSIDRDEWIMEPDREKIRSGKVNKKHIREMISTYMNKIDCLIDIYKHHKDDKHEMEQVAKDAAEILDEIKAVRKEDLAKYGREMCDGNIIFKALRRADYIGKLIKLKNLAYDKINSL